MLIILKRPLPSAVVPLTTVVALIKPTQRNTNPCAVNPAPAVEDLVLQSIFVVAPILKNSPTSVAANGVAAPEF